MKTAITQRARGAIVALLFSAIALNGCTAVVVTGIAVGAAAVHDRRALGKQIDDQGIELRITNKLRTDEKLDGTRIKVLSFNNVVLLAGEVGTDEQGRYALETARAMPGPKEVINELYVTASPGVGGRSRDTLLTGQVKSALVSVKETKFDPTRVKILSMRGIVYLMGIVSEEEADAVVEKVRRVRGVRRVVKVFEYQTA